MNLKDYLQQRRLMVDQALEEFLPADSEGGALLEAMRYSLFAGGKRVRPILCLAGAEAVGGSARDAMFCACALEMVHSYSLVHDDLPAMDDDDLRRGVPTSHKVFGEGMAVLAGDGLLTQAMVLLTDKRYIEKLDPARVLAAANLVMAGAGMDGMVGGQAADLLAEGAEPSLERVEYIHSRKTGALLTASVESGAVLGGGDDKQVGMLRRYGLLTGMAFQIADDLLDLNGDPRELGKSVGADQAHGKMTYPAVVGQKAASKAGWELVNEAASLAESLGPRAEPLALLAPYIMERTN